MKKRILSIFLVIVMLVTMLPSYSAFAYQYSEVYFCDGFEYVYESLYDGTIIIMGYYGEETEVVFPSKLNGKRVVRVDANKDNYNQEITSVTIPVGVGYYAFSGFTNLTDVIIKGSIIDSGAFSDCTNLKNLTINDAYLIEENAFYNCDSLANVTLPERLSKFEPSAFSSCDSLMSINVSENNATFSSLDGVLFSKDKKKLIKYPAGKAEETYIIPDTVVEICAYAFSGCTSLETITIPDNVTSIGDYAFSDCSSLRSVSIPDNVTSIGSYAFYDCISLKEIRIPKSVTEIKNHIFYNCSSLQNVMIPEGVTIISCEAFANCTSLQSLTIPKSVKDFDSSAFGNNSRGKVLTNLYYMGTADDWVRMEYYPRLKDVENLYFNNELVLDVTLSEGITRINGNAFADCTSLQTITIPDGVATIGGGAFKGCTSLQTITIPDGVATIGGGAFEGCTSLQSFIIPDSVTTIERSAFYGCKSLQNIVIPDSVTEIEDYAFKNCNGLISVSIGNGVKYIYDEVFAYCSNLINVTIGYGVTHIYEQAFLGCDSIWHILYQGTEKEWNNIKVVDTEPGFVSPLPGLSGKTKHYKTTGSEINLDVKQLPACETQGLVNAKCTVCDAETNVATTALGHEYVFVEHIDSTCIEKGYDSYNCIKCDDNDKKNYDGLVEHIFENGVCIYCNGLETDCVSSPHNYPDNYDNTWVISKLDATEIKVIFSEKTYTEPNYDIIYIYDANDNVVGKYSGSQLAGACITVNSDKVKIRLTSDDRENEYGFSVLKVEAFYGCKHNNTETRNTINLTCEKDGYTGDTYCLDCGELIANGNTISATGHTSSDWIIDTYNTCTTDGSKHKECTVCGETLETEVIEKVGHRWGDWITAEDPTCEENGSTFKACGICGEMEYGTIPAIGHNYVDNTCTNCGDTKVTLNGWVLEGSKWAYYQNNVKVTNKWLMDSVGWCFVGEDGYCVTNCWKADSKGWCYLDENGRMVINNWVLDNGKWYFMDANGYMVSNCWKKDSKGWCYLGSSGAMLTNAWVKDSVGWCYVGADGYCVTNKWVKDSKGWCYLDAQGRMVYNKWVKDSKGWCYVGSSGYMVTSQWVQDGSKWYYLDASGYMVTGTKVINGKTYKFNSSGVWIA